MQETKIVQTDITVEIELGDCLVSIIALGLALGTLVPSAWSGPWSLFVTPCSTCWLLPWTMTARCRLVLTRFSYAQSSHASSSDRLQYPLHEAVVLALRIYHPATVGGVICVVPRNLPSRSGCSEKSETVPV